MQFALEVVVLECSFLNHSQEILGVNHNEEPMPRRPYLIYFCAKVTTCILIKMYHSVMFLS
jgi:hypothetical protein